MQFIESKLTAAIATAKQKANGNRALLNAISKAEIGLRGAWIVTELHDGLMVTTDGGTYHATATTCGCAAFKNGMVCKHRCAVRIAALCETAPVRVPSRVVRGDGWHGQRNGDAMIVNGWLV